MKGVDCPQCIGSQLQAFLARAAGLAKFPVHNGRTILRLESEIDLSITTPLMHFENDIAFNQRSWPNAREAKLLEF